MHTKRIDFLDLHFDRLNFSEVTNRLKAATSRSRYLYIVTPNVDHVVCISGDPLLREVWDAAEICVCDSRILKFLAYVRGIKLPLVPGSDLCAALFKDVIERGDRIAIVGSVSSSVQTLQKQFPEIEFVHFEPAMNLRTNAAARSAAANFIANAHARFALLAVGSPQQEMIANEVLLHPSATGLGLCIGAGLDFVTGKQKRAPKLLQHMGLEWAYRLLSNPRRLWRRYMIEGMRIFPIWLRWRAGNAYGLLIRAVCALIALLAALTLASALSSDGKPKISTSVTMWLPQETTRGAAAVHSLPPPDLLKPLSVDEAGRENAQRPFAVRSDSGARMFVLHTDVDNRERALTCLAQAVYYEAAGEGLNGGRAVAQVVLNRVRHPGFPSTVCGVVYEGSGSSSGCQFSFTCDGSMQHIPPPASWARSKQIAKEALDGYVFELVGHATHYHADYVLPYWADSLDKSVQIGRHIFYRFRSTLGEPNAFSQRYGGAEPPFREPGPSIVLPKTNESEELANRLIGVGVPRPPNDQLKASPQPSSPLLADAREGTLIADKVKLSGRQQKKASTVCSTSVDHKKLAPLKADDMRLEGDAPGC